MPCQVSFDAPRNQGSGPGCVEFCVYWPLTYSANGTVIDAQFSEVSQVFGEVLFIFGTVYISVCSLIYWWLRRTSPYLQSRGRISIALICVGLFPQLHALQYREMIGRHKYICLLYMWGQLIVYASFNTPYIVRTFMVYHRYQYKRQQVLYWGQQNENGYGCCNDAEASIMKQKLARLKRKTTEAYGLKLLFGFILGVHLSMLALGLLQPKKYVYGCTGCENHHYEMLLFQLVNGVTSFTALWALYKVKGEKDPLHLVSELRVIQIVNFCFVEPMMLLGLWDPGHIGRDGLWLWGHFVTIGQLIMYSYTIPYQAYKSIGYNKQGLLEGKAESQLQTFLSDVNAGAFFIEYLVTEFSSENYFFYKRVQEWRSKSFPSKEAMREEANDIIRTFVDMNSPLEVNITGETRATILQALDGGNITSSSFDNATDEIYLILKNDSFPRFLKSEMYAKYTSLSSLGEKSNAVIVKSSRRLPCSRCYTR